jgi:type I restriction enzyme, S subunit
MWNTVKLEEIVNIDIGKTPSRNNPKYWDKEKKNSNVWVSIRDMSALSGLYVDNSREYISNEGAKLFKEVPKNTLIMSFKLSIGKLAITKINLWTNEAIAAFKIKDETLICKEYLYYFLSSMNWDIIAGHDIKVMGKTLNKAKLKEILIPLPPLTEQQRMVAKLDVVFAEVVKIKKNISKFKSIFKVIQKKILTSLINKDEYQWVEKTLPEICINLDNKRIPITKSKRNQGKIPYYGASGVVDYVKDWIFDDDLLLVSEDGANLLMRTYPIAFNVSGKCWVNNHAHILKFKDKKLQYWVKKYLNSIDLSEHITGMAQPKLNQSKLNIIKIPVPNSSIEGLITKIKSFEESFELLELQIHKKKELMNSLKVSFLKKILIKAA